MIGAMYRPRDVSYPNCNWWFDTIQAGQDVKERLYRTPGLALFADTGVNSETRGIKVPANDPNYMYAVVGNRAFRIDALGNIFTATGNLSIVSGHVQMESNGVQLMIIDDQGGYIFDFATLVLTQITDIDFSITKGTLTYQDGYFIYTDGEIFALSSLYDGTQWSSLDMAQAEGWPDPILAGLSDHRELWLFGTETTEIWMDTGASTFPFERVAGGFIEEGLGARFAYAKLDNTVCWLSNHRTILRASGYTPAKISPDWLDWEISRMSTVDDAFAFSYVLAGSYMLDITFPSADKTFFYNAKTGLWHRKSSGVDGGRHRANCYAYFQKKHYVGDAQTGKIYEMSMNALDDAGDPIRRVWTFPNISSQNDYLIYHSEVAIEFKPGIGLEDGSIPYAELCWSEGLESTWKAPRKRNVGAVGDYDRRTKWQQLGASRNRTYRLTVSDPVDWEVRDYRPNYSEGTS
jgi:hypothetical protein